MSSPQPEPTPGPSYHQTRERFSSTRKAEAYPNRYRPIMRHRREVACILAGLRGVPAGAHVLDLPCGSGRLTPVLVEHGYRVTGADSSEAMVQKARETWAKDGSGTPVCFETRDVMDTGFASEAFDAVVCNRLFHHLSEPSTRRIALAELGRICSGPLVVSFFNSFSAGAIKRRVKNFLIQRTPTDRIPIPLRIFAQDVQQAGLHLVRTHATRWGISPLWYAVLQKEPAPPPRKP